MTRFFGSTAKRSVNMSIDTSTCHVFGIGWSFPTLGGDAVQFHVYVACFRFGVTF